MTLTSTDQSNSVVPERPARRSWTVRCPEGALRLTPRDMDILKTLLDYRFLPTSLMMERFFRSKCFADRRLRKLYDHGLVDRIARPVVAGRAELIYVLTMQGARALAAFLGTPVGELGWSRGHSLVSARFLDHQLAVNRFRFILEDASLASPGYRMKEWLSAQQLTHKIPLLKIVPDAYILLETLQGTADLFLEMDLGTESASKVFKWKLEAYLAYGRSGDFHRDFKAHGFRVLTVVTSDARLLSLARVALSVGVPSMFWYARLADLHKHTILGRVWRRPDRPEEFHQI